jgi:hypothetical protein
MRQIKSIQNFRRQLFKIEEISLDVLHLFAARAHEVMMRFEIAIHPQGGRMGRNLSQQATHNEKPQIVIDRGERYGWNSASDRGVNVLWGIVSVRSDHSFIHDLALVCNRQTVLRGQLTELFIG